MSLLHFLLGLGETLCHEVVAVVLVEVIAFEEVVRYLAIEDAADLHQVSGVVVLV